MQPSCAPLLSSPGPPAEQALPQAPDGPGEAAAWLEGQLEAERRELERRHAALVGSLARALGGAGAGACGAEAESAEGAEGGEGAGAEGEAAAHAASAGGSREHLGGGGSEVSPRSFRTRSVQGTLELTESALRERGLTMPIQQRSYKESSRFHWGCAGAMGCWAFDPVHRYARRIIQSPMFDYCIGAVISANCMTIGLEIDRHVKEGAQTSFELQVLEHCFLTVYVLELLIRVVGDWQECLHSVWFRLDFTLVVIGVLTTWVLEPLLRVRVAVDVLDKVLVIRIVRLIRLVRTFRFLKFMQPLWKLVSGLLGSNRTVTSAGVLLFGAIYVFACAGVALLGQDEDLLSDPVAGPIVEDRFRSIPVLMLTLVQFTTCDSVAAIYHPLIRAKPLLVLYFLPILLVVPISLMNLITAVIVDHAIQISTHDAELERICMKSKLETLIPVLNRMFREFDCTHSGHISLADLDLSQIDIALPTEVISVLKSRKLENFFKLLDADSSGQITQSEWVDGMCCLVLDDVPIENMQMLQMLSKQSADLDALKRVLLPDEPSTEAFDVSPRP